MNVVAGIWSSHRYISLWTYARGYTTASGHDRPALCGLSNLTTASSLTASSELRHADGLVAEIVGSCAATPGRCLRTTDQRL